MSQHSLSRLAKIIIILFGVMGVAFYGAAVPLGGYTILADSLSMQNYYIAWLVFMELMAIPDYAVLVYAWKIADTIDKNKAFSKENVLRFKRVFQIAITTTVYFFIGNTVFFMLNLDHPSLYLVSFALSFIGASVAAVSLILSYMSQKAADLQEDNDLTI